MNLLINNGVQGMFMYIHRQTIPHPPRVPELLIMLSSRQTLIVIYVVQVIARGPCAMGYGVARVNDGFILSVKG